MSAALSRSAMFSAVLWRSTGFGTRYSVRTSGRNSNLIHPPRDSTGEYHRRSSQARGTPAAVAATFDMGQDHRPGVTLPRDQQGHRGFHAARLDPISNRRPHAGRRADMRRVRLRRADARAVGTRYDSGEPRRTQHRTVRGRAQGLPAQGQHQHGYIRHRVAAHARSHTTTEPSTAPETSSRRSGCKPPLPRWVRTTTRRQVRPESSIRTASNSTNRSRFATPNSCAPWCMGAMSQSSARGQASAIPVRRMDDQGRVFDLDLHQATRLPCRPTIRRRWSISPSVCSTNRCRCCATITRQRPTNDRI